MDSVTDNEKQNLLALKISLNLPKIMRYFIEFSYNGSTFLAIKFSQMRFLMQEN